MEQRQWPYLHTRDPRIHCEARPERTAHRSTFTHTGKTNLTLKKKISFDPSNRHTWSPYLQPPPVHDLSFSAQVLCSTENSLTYPPTHSPTHSFTHPPTHSLSSEESRATASSHLQKWCGPSTSTATACPSMTSPTSTENIPPATSTSISGTKCMPCRVR